MSLFQFMSLFAAVVTFIIGLFATLSHPERKLNQVFFIMTCLICVWQLNVYLGMGSQDPNAVVFWVRQSNALSAFIPASINLTLFAILFPDTSLTKLFWKNRRWLLMSLLMFLLCQTKWFLLSAWPAAEGDVLPDIEYGPAFSVLGIYFMAAFALLFRLMVKSTRELRGSGKAEMEYLMLSCGTGLFLGVFLFLVPQITGWKDLGALNPLSVIVFASITGYGIATRGFLDVSVLLRRIISYSMLVIYLSVLYTVTFFSTQFFMTRLGYNPLPVAHWFATVAVAFSVTPAQGIAQHLANRLFIISTPLNVGGILSDASRSLNTVLTVDQLSHRFYEILEKNLETTDLRIFVKEKDQFIQIFPADTPRRIQNSDPLPSYLATNHALCVRDLLHRRKLTEDISRISTELKKEDAAAAIGFHRDRQMLGFMLLGNRSSGRIYAKEATVAIEGLRDLFAVSFENAQLYTELQNGRIYMDLLLRNLVNGVLATDASGNITTCNQEASRILSCAEGSLTGKNIEHLPGELYAVQKRVLSKNLVIRDKEILLKDSENNPVYINVGASMFRDLKGKVMGSLLVLQDRTAIRNLEEQVKRSERLASLGTLSAGMAHEIKNPLVTLQTFTQLLPERFHDEEYRETFVNLASKEISRIDGLVNKLLSLARPVKLDLQEIPLNNLLEKYVKLFRQQARESQVEIVETYAANPDRIQGDADQLRQVLLNLLLNGQQAMPEGGTLYISTRNHEHKVELIIRDTGEGIAPENRDHVFDPFFTTKSAGTGLGLAVAHQILQEHQAVVRVDSSPGKGSAFHILFPMAVVEAAV